MTTLNESSRRAFLTAIAASGAAAAVVAAPGTAHAADEGTGLGFDDGSSGAAAPQVRTEAFAPPTTGTTYKFILGADFHGLDETATWNKGFGQIETGAAATVFYYPLSDLPVGARITEVTFAVIKSAVVAYSGVATYFAYRITSGAINLIDSRSNGALPQQPAEQYVNLVVDPTDARWIVDNQLEAGHYLVATLTNSRVNSVRVGYVPGPTTPLSFIPISPKRAYDSRFVAPLGPLPNNTNRVISVANSFVTGTGTPETSNIIPATARAIAYNLTVVNTVGQGFLSVNPGDAVAPGGSSINWFAPGQLLANGLVVNLDNNRQVNVFCGGGGTTDFIIDILGYYV